jgi:Patatin-like phospholipase
MVFPDGSQHVMHLSIQGDWGINGYYDLDPNYYTRGTPSCPGTRPIPNPVVYYTADGTFARLELIYSPPQTGSPFHYFWFLYLQDGGAASGGCLEHGRIASIVLAVLTYLSATNRNAVKAFNFESLRKLEAEDVNRGKLERIPDHLRDHHVGLALSGGGVRSATFGLGVLQGLGKSSVLRELDYISSVSGGGFVGCWFAKLIADNDFQTACGTAAAAEACYRAVSYLASMWRCWMRS